MKAYWLTLYVLISAVCIGADLHSERVFHPKQRTEKKQRRRDFKSLVGTYERVSDEHAEDGDQSFVMVVKPESNRGSFDCSNQWEFV